jgi:ATPase subunit of ABC transporter with duplicated ATPase domains
VVISHDHRFLDNVATHILDVDYGTVTLYHGNYSRFMVDKQEIRERKEAEIGRIEKEIADKKAFVERFRYKKTKARQAQSRLKQIEKIDIPDLPSSSRRAPHFRFEQQRPSGREVLVLDGVAKAFGDNQVLNDVSLTVRRGERLGIIGANGLGKSTLLKIMVERLEADAGEVRWGYEAQQGYFAQNHRDLLDDSKETALDYLWAICPDAPTSFVRGQLGRMLFSGEDVDKPLRALSGGEAARLVFSRLIVQRPNVLLLDEPTNHLDLESIEALVAALKDYSGTLVFVSHDRWFVSELATRIVELRADGFEDFPGNYQDYLARCGDDHLDANAVALKAAGERSAAREAASQKAGSDYQEQKRRRNLERRLVARRDEVTAEIESSEQRQAEIEQLYCQPGFFENTAAAEIEALQNEQAELGPRIEERMAEWEQIEEQLAEMEGDGDGS